MKLRNKLKSFAMDNHIKKYAEHNANELEKIFDNYATQYAEWCCARAIGVTYFKLNKEELDQFKKEKGL